MSRDKETPSSLVFSAARGITEDMKEGVESLSEDLVDYIAMLAHMADALRETKRNLERYAIPIAPQKSKERRMMRKKIKSIHATILTCLSIKKTLETAMDDISITLPPGGWEPVTRDFLFNIMEPTDNELRRIDEEFGDPNDPTNDWPDEMI